MTVSQLGITSTRRVNYVSLIKLHTSRSSRRTLARNIQACVSSGRQDTHDTAARLALFREVKERFGSLDFRMAYQQACMGPRHRPRDHIKHLLDMLEPTALEPPPS